LTAVIEDALRQALAGQITLLNANPCVCPLSLVKASNLASTWTILALYSTLWKQDMILTDINILVYAFRTDAPSHSIITNG